MCARMLNSLKEAKEALEEHLSKINDTSNWMVGVWCVDAEGKIWLHRTSFDFPTEKYDIVLYGLADEFNKERMNKLNADNLASEPLRRAMPFGRFPMGLAMPPEVKEEVKEEEPKPESTEEGEVG